MSTSWKEDLDKNGFAVVRGVLSQEKCDYYIDSMYRWLESFPYGFKRDDAATYVPAHLPNNMKGGMYHGYSVQHEQFVWQARMEPSVIKVFQELWETENLLASFDGINFTLPRSIELSGVDGKAWPHVDQSPARTVRHPNISPA